MSGLSKYQTGHVIYMTIATTYTRCNMDIVLWNHSPAKSTPHATLGLTLTPCKSMEGGMWFQGDYDSFLNKILPIQIYSMHKKYPYT